MDWLDEDPGLPIKFGPCSNGEYQPEPLSPVITESVRRARDWAAAVDGSFVPLEAETICVHGDTPGSDQLAARLRAGFEAAGITVRAVGGG